MNSFKIGQRWISEMEPELGLGIVKQIDNRFVEIHFPASECEYKYAMASAPLKRVEFRAGDTIESRDGRSFTVKSTSNEDGIIIYQGENVELPESELNDFLSFTTPLDRLMNGFIDKNRDFNLRYRSLINQHQTRKSAIRGFIGGRIDLIPHQLYVVNEIASLPIPRVLLSDETGLGKTIEVCLVLHRLLINGRINRVLILVPHSLVHQWFVELLRRFNLIFRIFDEEYCESMESSDPGTNPFLDDQLGLCSIDFLTSNLKRSEQAIATGWDMLVIDEAHHLTEKSPEYAVAKKLSAVTQGMMLLTATPEQLGHRSHFARLHLLDPARYPDFSLFEREENLYQEITGIANKLVESDLLNKADLKMLEKLSPGHFAEAGESFALDLQKITDFRNRVVEDLMDRHGTGRAVYRNTRATMTGFPKREALLIPVQANDEGLDYQINEFEADQNFNQKGMKYNYNNDPRIDWLVQFLKKRKDKKVLLICHSIEKVKAIEEALRSQININIALFHEDLTLLQRDRNASWFAEKSGAQILVCSEIGSEGRNFQFSHCLVLFDLPLDPELLEQRIGRLDRIGQKETIFIYVPYFTGSEYEILARWYHEGLNAFEENVPGVYQIFQKMSGDLKDLIVNKQSFEFENFLKETRELKSGIAQKLRKGRDRLLELNSFRSKVAENLILGIKTVDSKRVLEKFMLGVFSLYGIRHDEIFDRTYKLKLTLLFNPEFPLPALKHDDLTVTFDRNTALSHEYIEFLTWDHPMVIGVMDLILGSEKGNCTVAVWPDEEAQEILLEAIYVLECVAPKSLYVDRFLPPVPVRVVVNHLLQDCRETHPVELLAKHLKRSKEIGLLDNPEVRQELIPKMLGHCKKLAEKDVPDIIKDGLHLMDTSLLKEVNRLVELKKVNNNIKQKEISICEQEIDALREAILSARLRLDALRFITRGKL